MKKHIALCFVIAGLFGAMNLSANAAINKTLKTDIHAIRIPAGTTMKLELLEPVSTAVGSVGDEFSAMMKEDKIVNGKIALPAGSMIRGTVNRIVPNKRLSRSAIMYFNFDHVVTPTGRQIPLNAGLYNFRELTLDGGVFQGGNYGYAIQQNWQTSKNILSKTIDWGKGTGDNMQYVCVPVGAVGGVFGGAAYYAGMAVADLFKKGNNVNWEQGKQFEIMLVQPLDIPLH